LIEGFPKKIFVSIFYQAWVNFVANVKKICFGQISEAINLSLLMKSISCTLKLRCFWLISTILVISWYFLNKLKFNENPGQFYKFRKNSGHEENIEIRKLKRKRNFKFKN